MSVSFVTPDGPVDVHIAVLLVPLAYIAGAWLAFFWFGLNQTFYDDRCVEWWAAVFWPVTVLLFIVSFLVDGWTWLTKRYPKLFARAGRIGFWLIFPLRPGETGRRIRRFFHRRDDPWDERPMDRRRK